MFDKISWYCITDEYYQIAHNVHTFLEVHTQIEAADSTPCEILKPNFITISQGVEPAASICVCTAKNVCTLWAILKPNFATIVVLGNNGDIQYIIMCIYKFFQKFFARINYNPY